MAALSVRESESKYCLKENIFPADNKISSRLNDELKASGFFNSIAWII